MSFTKYENKDLTYYRNVFWVKAGCDFDPCNHMYMKCVRNWQQERFVKVMYGRIKKRFYVAAGYYKKIEPPKPSQRFLEGVDAFVHLTQCFKIYQIMWGMIKEWQKLTGCDDDDKCQVDIYGLTDEDESWLQRECTKYMSYMEENCLDSIKKEDGTILYLAKVK